MKLSYLNCLNNFQFIYVIKNRVLNNFQFQKVCVLQLKTEPGIITIFNTYSPHSLINQKYKTKAEEFYCSIHKTVEETKTAS